MLSEIRIVDARLFVLVSSVYRMSLRVGVHGCRVKDGAGGGLYLSCVVRSLERLEMQLRFERRKTRNRLARKNLVAL